METSLVEIEEESTRLQASMAEICDAAMPRVKHRPPKRAVYWWSSEIADLRVECIAAQRAWTRQRGRRPRDEAREAVLNDEHRRIKKTLQIAIAEAKTSAREEMLQGLDRDPWGRPYRMARGKLRSQAAPVTETLEPTVLESVVDTLFPSRDAHVPPSMSSLRDSVVDGHIPPVTAEELGTAVLRLRAKNTAPGPDGIPGKVWVMAEEYVEQRFRRLLDACLADGRFPTAWKVGRLVLLKKDGRPEDSPSAFRPIVLLDEAGKLFERILASRINQHLAAVGPDLAECQYGFRQSRSTIDAIQSVKALSEEAVSRGEVVLAVSLDIANAFNSLPFECIGEALGFHGVPSYICRVIHDYLRNRRVVYQNREGRLISKSVSCGVPQGSVLGPLLWNIGYDWVLRGALLRGLSVVCYADDTLVTARAETFERASLLASVGVTQVVRRIEMLGLRVALNKTEALFFFGARRRVPPSLHLRIGGVQIKIGATMKYLGLVLDPKWKFEDHFNQLLPKLVGTAAALGRMLPNVGGPNATVRRLYMTIVRSMATYGAPVWADALNARCRMLLRRPQRIITNRAIRGYRTISFEAACVLAGTPPWELEAGVLASVYEQRAERRSLSERPMTEEVAQWRRRAQRVTLRHWRERLEQPNAGRWTIDAVRPVLKEWVSRKEGSLSFRLVQVLSGHGCFGRYLCHVAGRESTEECHHCGAPEDTAEHTLAVCTGFDTQRAILAAAIGINITAITLPTVVKAMVEDVRVWSAMQDFCEEVIALKEEAERAREDDPSSDPARRRRTGRRRRGYAQLLPPP